MLSTQQDLESLRTLTSDMSVRESLDLVSLGGKTHPEFRQHHPMGWDSGLKKKREGAECQQSAVS